MQIKYKMALIQSFSCDGSYRSTMAIFEHILKLMYPHKAVHEITLQKEDNNPATASHVLDGK